MKNISTEKILKITKADLDDGGFYKEACLAFDGSIEIEAGLGTVRFKKSLSASLKIVALAGSGIEAGSGIKAGLGIEAGWGIEAGEGIEAGSGIKAGWGIKAGRGIKAGEGIEAGLGIKARTIFVKLRIFAGLCLWRIPKPEEMEIRAEIISGTVAFGILKKPEAKNG